MTQAPTRVLWVTKGLGRGGAEQLLSVSVPHLHSERLHVEVAYVLPWKDALAQNIRAQGIPVHCLGGSRRSVTAWVLRLIALVRSGRYDIVHTHSPLPAVVARAAAGRNGPAIVHTEHNVWQRYRMPSRLLNAATYGRNRAVVAVSSGVAESVQRPVWMPWVRLPPVEVVHHGIDEGRVRRGASARAKGRQLLGLGADERVIGTVGNMTPKKDQQSLLAAARHLSVERTDLRVVLVGSGPLEGELRARARELELEERVLFAGSRDDVQEILPAFDVFVLSSLHEGLSIALIEAMAAGLPCVATRVGGIPEAIRDGQDGLLVPPRDTTALAQALAKLLDDPPLRAAMGAAGIVRSARFSIESAVERIQDIYNEVLGVSEAAA